MKNRKRIPSVTQNETTIGGERHAHKPEEKRKINAVGRERNAYTSQERKQKSIVVMVNGEDNREGDVLTISDPSEIKIAKTSNRKQFAALTRRT